MTKWHYPQRKSPRLQGYDYSQEGAYFVTICVRNRLHLFGDVVKGTMMLNDAGHMVMYWWGELAKKYDVVDLDYYVTMPNHFHGIRVINRGHRRMPPIDTKVGGHVGPPLQDTGLSDILQWFKTMTTNAYIKGVKSQNWQRFNRKLWQRSFHDKIIYGEQYLNHLRQYVLHNPELWEEDTFY